MAFLSTLPTRLAGSLGGSGRQQSSRVTGLMRRLALGTRQRAEVWQLLADVLEGSGEDLGRMMDAVAEGYELQGKRLAAGALREIRAGLGEGRLAARMAPYCGTAERILFEGLGKQAPAPLFGAAARLLRSQMRMQKAVWGAVALPILLMFGFIGLVLFFGLSLLPSLAQIVDFDALPGFQGWIVRATIAFSANPLALAVWIAAAAAGLALLMRYWTGWGRVAADRFPPFSVARLQAGAGFLFAIVEYGRSGQPITTQLISRMAEAAAPYPRSRMRALARCFTAGGNNLGEASLMAGQGFPTLELVAVLRTLWNKPDGIDRIGAVLERWLNRVEETVKASMAALNAALLTLIAGALLALMSIAMPIFNQINSGGF